MNHTFSIEMKSKKNVHRLSVSNGSHEGVLFSGDLGKLINLVFIEKSVFEIRGSFGILRIDLSEDDFRNFLMDEVKKND